VKLGITLFGTDTGIRPAELARAVEERGFHSLYLPEHTHLPAGSVPPGLVDGVTIDDYRRSLDPLVALAAASAVTERILLGTGVLLVAQHDPIVLAKQIATLDALSGGRFTLGVGFGWNRTEAADHGVDFASRREVTVDKMRCMRALWSRASADHVEDAGAATSDDGEPATPEAPGSPPQGTAAATAPQGRAAATPPQQRGTAATPPQQRGTAATPPQQGTEAATPAQQDAAGSPKHKGGAATVSSAYRGEFASVSASYAWPKPLRQPGPRTLVGGGAGPKLFAAIAEYADGWMPIGGTGIRAALRTLHAAFEAAGRDPATAEVVPFGTIPDAGKLHHFASLGITEVVLRVPNGPRGDVLRTLDAHATHL
jgi:alkanesulfonate monooxygenase SsuD/methylene tetrahydromethanopterin reductase-like flavin-dependent oxidoreductase (luciferase family)